MDVPVPDQFDQFEQLQAADTLVDRGVDDVLDEGYVTPENWSAAQRFGNTPAEARQGETLEMRMAQEEPDVTDVALDEDWRHGEDRQCGSRRAGRLVDANHGYPGVDDTDEAIGEDVGIDGGAASAEEAAMHIIDDEDEDLERI